MDDMTDPELKAEEERKAHRARRLERQARRKMREEMAAIALSAAADQAREAEVAVDTAVVEAYENQAGEGAGEQIVEPPADRKAVTELLRVGKRLELQGSGIFIDLWPEVLSFCGRGWFEVEEEEETSTTEDVDMAESDVEYMDAVPSDDRLSLPHF